MKAVLCEELAGPDGLVVRDIPVPDEVLSPGPGRVAVRVHAVGLNFFDTLITRGRYQYKPQVPFSPGGEIAGVVTAVGAGVTQVAVGTRVCAYIGWGGAREMVVADAAALVRIPDAVPDCVAAGLSVTYGTAMHGLRDRGRLQAGDVVAVLGAAGGAGLAAVEVAHQLGARVIAVASNAEKLEICRAHGADLTLNYSNTDLKSGLRALTDGRGVDVVYDCVGGDAAEPALRAMAWLGRYLVVGFAAGDIPKFPANLILLKCCDVAGVFWGEVAVRDPAQQARNINQVMGWVAQGALQPHVHARFDLAEVSAALDLIVQRKVRGKIILEIAPVL